MGRLGVSPGIHEFILPPCPIIGFLYNLKIGLDPILIAPLNIFFNAITF
jgi:hypothetical protein